MTVGELSEYLKSLVDLPSIGKHDTVDGIICGDPSMQIDKVGTCWLAYRRTLEQACGAGVKTLIVHEPVFYSDHDLVVVEPAYAEEVERKKKWIESHGMAVIRCHDVLDAVPDIGIPFSLGRALGFPDSAILRSRRYYNVYAVIPDSAEHIAAAVARSLVYYGQPGVAFYGDPHRVVASVGVGTGCISNPIAFSGLQPDLFVAIDDSVRTWVEAPFAADSGTPLVVVNHGTSEEAGMQELSNHLQSRFTGIETLHFPQGCTYRWIPA